MADSLTETPSGLRIKRNSYNVFIYANDLLIVNTTVIRLLNVFDYANYYITEHGIQFNTSKTTSVTFGKSHLENPRWHLNGIELPVSGELNYFGAIIANQFHSHQQKQLKAARKAFHALQGSGIWDNVVKPDVVAHLWRALIQLILPHGSQSLPINKTDIPEIDKSQAKLLKSVIGLHKYYRNSPLSNTINVNKIPTLRDTYTLDLIRNAMYS